MHFKLKGVKTAVILPCCILGLQYKLLSVGNNIFAKDSQIKHQMYPFLCTNFSHISYLPFYVALEMTSSNIKNFIRYIVFPDLVKAVNFISGVQQKNP